MNFDFLPNLPTSTLDDRTLDDLMAEARLRIPRYCPEWTNFNPSDPGMTVIELFGWMTEQMMRRFNQVPRHHYVAFLELLGTRLRPPVSAQVDLTFYLNSALPEPYTIPAGIEVATIRTENDDAVVFTTDRSLTVGKPRIQHFLSSPLAEDTPQRLRDRLTHQWTQDPSGAWAGGEQLLFEEHPQAGNTAYLVFEPDEILDGNVLALTIKGEAATATGINPQAPPRRWEAWDGRAWVSVLRTEDDDNTQGFSFSSLTEEGKDPLQGADTILHLPLTWPVSAFSTYRGRWLRCVCTSPTPAQPAYCHSPRIVGVSARAIGGTVSANQATVIRDERLGTSNGTPNQSFRLLNHPILPRKDGEYMEVCPPDGLPQRWQEVTDFAESTAESRHYVMDAVAGTIQFGPCIREPSQVREAIQHGLYIQAHHVQAHHLHAHHVEAHSAQGAREQATGRQPDGQTGAIASAKRQYGAIPPRGSTVRMVCYRTGGGTRGNVQAGTVRVLKTAIPYVAQVTNHDPARYGADAESLEQAVMRVPRLLRSRDRAVTPEDFETLTVQGGGGAIAHARCLPAQSTLEAGTIKLLAVPHVPLPTTSPPSGVAPDQFTLTSALKRQLTDYLDERKLLGTHVVLEEPTYVGVSVRADIGLAPAYQSPQAQDIVQQDVLAALYRFLNPVTGGEDGTGWAFGRPVYPSDVIALIQRSPGVQYLGTVQLFEVCYRDGAWVRQMSPEAVIHPGEDGLVCSWDDRVLRSGHVVRFVGR